MTIRVPSPGRADCHGLAGRGQLGVRVDFRHVELLRAHHHVSKRCPNLT